MIKRRNKVRRERKMKKRTKIIISIIIIFCVVMGLGYLYVRYEESRVKALILCEDQIHTDSVILNRFMTAINNNDENVYSGLTTSQMSSNNIYEDMVKDCKNDFGEFKSATYEKALRSGSYEVLLFNANFTRKNNVEIIVSLDSNSKIAGINFK